jgi:hypothetical protein
MIGHLLKKNDISRKKPTRHWFYFDALSSMILSEISKMVSISYRGKEAILAWVVELETFTLSTHEVLGAGLWVVVFL